LPSTYDAIGSSSRRTSNRREGSSPAASFGSQACQNVLPITTRMSRAVGMAAASGEFSTSSLPSGFSTFQMRTRGTFSRP
jgi:hypothetical protein